MTRSAQDILKLIAEIGGDPLARRAAKACAGRRIRLSPAALRQVDHPLQSVLGKVVIGRLGERLSEMGSHQLVARFPAIVETAYLRERRERASLIRQLILDGRSTPAVAIHAKVSSRTVTYHRSRMRAAGLLPSGGARG